MRAWSGRFGTLWDSQRRAGWHTQSHRRLDNIRSAIKHGGVRTQTPILPKNAVKLLGKVADRRLAVRFGVSRGRLRSSCWDLESVRLQTGTRRQQTQEGDLGAAGGGQGDGKTR